MDLSTIDKDPKDASKFDSNKSEILLVIMLEIGEKKTNILYNRTIKYKNIFLR